MNLPSGNDNAARSRIVVMVMLALSLCVVVQMLGVPATLLNPDAMSDTLGNSVLEGFSVPPAVVDLRPLITIGQTDEIPLTVSHSLLITVPFHPPVSSSHG